MRCSNFRQQCRRLALVCVGYVWLAGIASHVCNKVGSELSPLLGKAGLMSLSPVASVLDTVLSHLCSALLWAVVWELA